MYPIKAKLLVILLIFSTFFSFTAFPAFAATSYLYDANGNMTSDGTNCYTYNETNQLAQVKNCSTNQTTAEYIYDYNGNRLVKKIYTNGVLSKTVYSPGDEYETTKIASNGANQNTSYYFANGQLIAKKNPDGSKIYYQNDHLGSTGILTDQSGNLVEETSYDPWGDIKSGGLASKYLYTGQEKDPETNLNYYNARYYDSSMRRFTQADDVIANIYNPQGLNRYSYVNNNPVNYTDPTGHMSEYDPYLMLASGIVGASFATIDDAVRLVTELQPEVKVMSVDQRALVANLNKSLYYAAIDGGINSMLSAAEVMNIKMGLGGYPKIMLSKKFIPRSAVPYIVEGLANGVAGGINNTFSNIGNNKPPQTNLVQSMVSEGGKSVISKKFSDTIFPQGGKTNINFSLNTNSKTTQAISNQTAGDIFSHTLDYVFKSVTSFFTRK